MTQTDIKTIARMLIMLVGHYKYSTPSQKIQRELTMRKIVSLAGYGIILEDKFNGD